MASVAPESSDRLQPVLFRFLRIPSVQRGIASPKEGQEATYAGRHVHPVRIGDVYGKRLIAMESRRGVDSSG